MHLKSNQRIKIFFDEELGRPVCKIMDLPLTRYTVFVMPQQHYNDFLSGSKFTKFIVLEHWIETTWIAFNVPKFEDMLNKAFN